MKRNRKLLCSISAVAVMLTTSGCLDSSSDVSNIDAQSEFMNAQAREYARSFEQYAMQSSQLLFTSASIQAGHYEDSVGVIDMAALGAGDGSSETYIESGFCITDPADPKEATHITWLESDSEDDFVLKGLGNNARGAVLDRMSNLGQGITVATYLGDGEIMRASSIYSETLPDDCHFAQIPIGSPLLVTKIALPQLPEDTVRKNEFTTGACAPSQTGHKLYRADVTYYPDGRFYVGGTMYNKGARLPGVNSGAWTLLEDSCKDPVVNLTMNTVDGVSRGTAFTGGMLNASDVADEISGNLTQISCKKAAKYEIEIEDTPEETVTNKVVIEIEATEDPVEVAVVPVEKNGKAAVKEIDEETKREDFKFKRNGREYFGHYKAGRKYVRGFYEHGKKYGFDKDEHGRRHAYHYNNRGHRELDARSYAEFVDDIREEELEAATNTTTTTTTTTTTATVTPVAASTTVESNDLAEAAAVELASYDTCGKAAVVIDVGNVGDTRVELDRVEDYTTPCGGTAGTYEDSLNGFTGTVSHPLWNGEAHYTRDVFSHRADNILNASVSREMRESWVGESISCERNEDLNITCATSNPGLNHLQLTNGNGFNYTRNNTINGWANSETYEPNDPANPAWNFRADASGCEWLEQDTWGCNVGSLGQQQAGLRERDYTVASLGAAPVIASWDTVRPAICRDEKQVDVGCTGGQTGQRIDTERRTYTSNTPGSGSWSAWTVVSTNDTCRDENSGGGNDGGGATSCLLAGTKVLMADGTTKAIENVQIGEMTAAGRVLQTYNRLYNNAVQQTAVGLYMNNGGLFEHDGIQATGRHPLFMNGRWLEMGDNIFATPIEGTQGTIVYNLLTENHVIPLVGDSGEIYAYADDLNNIHNTAEKGRIKTAYLFANKSKKIA